jgi:protein TonB
MCNFFTKWSGRLILIALLFVLAANSEKSSINAANDEDYLAFVPKMPEPVGGLEAIVKKIVYPSLARQQGVQGKVYLLVYVNENGGVDDVKIVKGIGMGCDEAAIDAVKKHKFTPGQDKGQNVKVKLSIALTFKMN